ncbi:hypothetical protein Patl1_25924 [Pistacia atlantica]|uniref:Uncharacterized protein n=1 Tax=Pistacia atlantica TaxID=434234 RepID=A0ACC1B453_9ROSI|nr:hypothetical protein Patl1_25924 [Pistacia atlantica]
MDMDFDIPLPEELELLEADARLHDPYLDEYLDLEPPEQDLPDSPPPQLTPHKRTRSESPSRPIDDTEPQFDDKRTKIVVNDDEDNENDEDWLRYSPPKQSNGDLEEREDATVVVQEKVLSRYAFEIDGDCLPVTAPSGGDRVYVKICGAQGEERVKKLNVKSYSNGLISEPVNILLQKVEQEAFAKVNIAVNSFG